MKILSIGHSLAHYRQRAMWEWIAKQGHKVDTLVMPKYQNEVYKPINDGSFTQNLSNIYSSATPNFWHFPSLHEYIHNLDPDIVFCYQEPWSVSTYYAMCAAKMFKKPFGFFTWENIRRLLPSPYRRIQADVIHGSDLIVAGNTEASRIMLDTGGDFVVKELQTGLDTNLLVPTPKLILEEKIEPRKLLFIGRLVKEKGIEVILRAFDKLDDNYILHFTGGRGEMEPVIKSHPEFGKRISMSGWVDYKRVPKVYSWGDVSLMPSIDTEIWREQCGYVVGESLLCFLPVVTTFSKSIAEWWKLPDVNFIQQNDADMLADILSKDELYHEAKEGRKAVIEKYSNEIIGQNYIDMMEEVI